MGSLRSIRRESEQADSSCSFQYFIRRVRQEVVNGRTLAFFLTDEMRRASPESIMWDICEWLLENGYCYLWEPRKTECATTIIVWRE
ncbi:hypothetical protein ACFL2Q_20370 [Thermodesulfobacteriota bacterium]